MYPVLAEHPDADAKDAKWLFYPVNKLHCTAWIKWQQLAQH